LHNLDNTEPPMNSFCRIEVSARRFCFGSVFESAELSIDAGPLAYLFIKYLASVNTLNTVFTTYAAGCFNVNAVST
jgi:hypothetical protein